MVSDKELTTFSENVGGYLEMEGFLSVSLSEGVAFQFLWRL